MLAWEFLGKSTRIDRNTGILSHILSAHVWVGREREREAKQRKEKKRKEKLGKWREGLCNKTFKAEWRKKSERENTKLLII